MEFMTQAKYAAQRGISRQAVNKLVRAGRLAGHGPQGLIDPTEADEVRSTGTIAEPARRQPAPIAEAPKGPSYATARTAREAYQAKHAQLDYEERIHNLIAVDEVEDATFELGQRLQQLMQGRAEALAAELARLTNGNFEAIRAAIGRADLVLQQDIATRFKEMAGEAGDEQKAA